MGYTTEFEGRFALDRLPPAEVIVRLRELEGDDGRTTRGMPDAYCQWQLTKDCMGIEWDGNEKFYHYAEWLQWIIDNVLAPAGLSLSGEVAYSGEDPRDSGALRVEGGKVERVKHEAIRDEVGELRRFRDFVLASEWGDDVMRDWRRSGRGAAR